MAFQQRRRSDARQHVAKHLEHRVTHAPWSRCARTSCRGPGTSDSRRTSICTHCARTPMRILHNAVEIQRQHTHRILAAGSRKNRRLKKSCARAPAHQPRARRCVVTMLASPTPSSSPQQRLSPIHSAASARLRRLRRQGVVAEREVVAAVRDDLRCSRGVSAEPQHGGAGSGETRDNVIILSDARPAAASSGPYQRANRRSLRSVFFFSFGGLTRSRRHGCVCCFEPVYSTTCAVHTVVRTRHVRKRSARTSSGPAELRQFVPGRCR
jgi:hypothetical protein